MTRRIAVLVTGSREWTDREAIRRALCSIDTADADEIILIHGDCGKRDEDGIPYVGADLLADGVVRCFGWEWTPLPMPAPWDQLGSQAGPSRNQWMVNVLVLLQRCGYECHAFAFPLERSSGTWDCVRKLKTAGFEPLITKPEPA